MRVRRGGRMPDRRPEGEGEGGGRMRVWEGRVRWDHAETDAAAISVAGKRRGGGGGARGATRSDRRTPPSSAHSSLSTTSTPSLRGEGRSIFLPPPNPRDFMSSRAERCLDGFRFSRVMVAPLSEGVGLQRPRVAFVPSPPFSSSLSYPHVIALLIPSPSHPIS